MAQGHTLLPSTQHTLQEAAIHPKGAALWPRDIRRSPYSHKTAPHSLQSTLSSGTCIPMVPSVHRKTTRLQISQPTESITKQP